MKYSLLPILAALVITEIDATEWVTTYDGSTTATWAGTITLDDWGFTGPQGRQADSFDPYGGVFGNGNYESMGAAFCINDPAACGIGQVQHVITSGPDGKTPDAPALILDDFLPNTGDFENANVDSLATFFFWGYTSPAGSTFSNMLIDLDGDYHIAKDDMAFAWYGAIDYTQVVADGAERVGTTPDGTYNNSLAFQPYAVSDARGWCGSVIAAHPNAHEAMAGQVMFDMAIDVYRRDADGTLQYFSTEVTSDFEMRSFGDIVINLSQPGGDTQSMSARAVVNNTSPDDPMYYDPVNTPTIDANMSVDLAYHNKVSFMGANILLQTEWCGIESAQWLAGDRGPGVKRLSALRKDLTSQAACETEGGTWSYNAFSGSSYILRADAGRFIDYFDESVYGPDPMTIDTDSDGVLDVADNCTLAANPGQQDTDSDNYGNACDADLNNDNFVNSLDIGPFADLVGTSGPDIEADLDSDGVVGLDDMAIFKSLFFQPPGPSGTAK